MRKFMIAAMLLISVSVLAQECEYDMYSKKYRSSSPIELVGYETLSGGVLSVITYYYGKYILHFVFDKTDYIQVSDDAYAEVLMADTTVLTVPFYKYTKEENVQASAKLTKEQWDKLRITNVLEARIFWKGGMVDFQYMHPDYYVKWIKYIEDCVPTLGDD